MDHIILGSWIRIRKLDLKLTYLNRTNSNPDLHESTYFGKLDPKLIRIRVKLDPDPLQSKISEALEAYRAVTELNFVKKRSTL